MLGIGRPRSRQEIEKAPMLSDMSLRHKTAQQPHRLKPTAVDLFSGIGGISLEFIQAGFEIACAVDCPS